MLLALVAAFAAQDAPDGRRVFANNCSHCHVAPDPKIASDSIWTGRIKATA